MVNPSQVMSVAPTMSYATQNQLNNINKLQSPRLSNNNLSSKEIKEFNVPEIKKKKERYDSRIGMYVSAEKEDQFGTTIVTRAPDVNINPEKIKKKKERYDSRIGMYVSAEKEDQFGTTIVTRTPTLEEKKLIEEANLRGSIFDRPGEQIIRQGRIEEKNIKEFQELTKDIDKLEGKDFEKRIKEIQKIDGASVVGKSTKEGQEYSLLYQPSTVGIGIGLEKKQVPISRFDTGGQLSLYGSALSYGIERGALKVGFPEEQKTEVKEIPKEIVKIWNLETISNQKIVVPKGLPSARAVGDVLSTGRYFIPGVGGALFFGEAIEKEARGTLSKEEGLLVGGTALVLGGLKLKGVLTEEKIVKGSVRGGNTIKIEGIEKRIPVATESGIKEYALFKDLYVRTQKTALVQSKLGNFLKREPKIKILENPQTYVLEPLKNIFGAGIEVGQPYWARFGRIGKKGDIVNARFYQVSPKQKNIIPEEISFLPKSEKNIFRKIVEEKKTKTPIREEDIGKYFTEEQKLQLGLTTDTRLGKIGTGKATSSFGSGSSTILKEKFGSGVEIFRADIGTVDITNPLRKGLGKLDDINLRSRFIIRAPIIEKEATKKGFMGGGSKSSQEFLKNLYKLESPKVIPKPKVVLPKASSSSSNTIIDVVEKIKTPKESLFAGLGIYELTSGNTLANINLPGSSIFPLVSAQSNQNIDIESNVGINLSSNLNNRNKPVNKTLQLPLQRDELKPTSLTNFNNTPESRQNSSTAQKSKLSVAQALKSGQESKQELSLINTTTSSRTITKPPKKPKLKPLLTPSGEDKESKDKILGEDFEVFVREKRKDVSIGKFKNIKSAKSKLFKTLRKEIRASGFIESDGRKININLGGTGFRRSKRDSFRIVEPKNRRIKRGTKEVFQIRQSRKKKGGFF